MSQSRVPKGTPKTGGQFAAGRKPEGDDLVLPQRGQAVTTAPWTQEKLIERKVFFAKRVAAQNKETTGYAYDWYAMERVMVAYGGVAAVPPMEPEDNIFELVDNGTFSSDPAIMREGDPSQCHANTAQLWTDGEIDEICTGYALSGDGLWRQHSWGRKNGKTVETTEPRLAYYGYVVEDPKDWSEKQLR
jgi:hypothetical protein